MPWKEDGPMEQRIELLREWSQGASITALAEIYSISRNTIYKWIERHAAEGVAGLADRSRAPHSSPQRLSEEMVERIIEARQPWGWGARKLIVKLAAAGGEKPPAASMVAELLRAKGLSRSGTVPGRTVVVPGPLKWSASSSPHAAHGGSEVYGTVYCCGWNDEQGADAGSGLSISRFTTIGSCPLRTTTASTGSSGRALIS